MFGCSTPYHLSPILITAAYSLPRYSPTPALDIYPPL